MASIIRGVPLSPVLLFLLSFGVYQANLRPVASLDSMPAALLPFAIWGDGTLQLDRFAAWLAEKQPGATYAFHERGGHFYSSYPIAQPLLLAPLYLPVLAAAGSARWTIANQVLFARILEKLFASFLAAATVTALFLLLSRLATRRTALLLAGAFAFGTQNWSTSSQALWQHSAGGLFLVLAMLGLARSFETPSRGMLLASSLSAALAILIRPSNILLSAAIVVALLLDRAGVSAAVRFAMLPAIAVCLTAAYNFWLFGDVRGLYSAPMQLAPLSAAAGLLASPARGLLIYSPFLLLAIPGARSRPVDARAALCRTTAILFCLAHIAAFSFWPMWWGGFCWGPRLLTEIAPFAVLLIAPGLDAGAVWFRYALFFLVVPSVLLQATGAFYYPHGDWDSTPLAAAANPARLWDWVDNPVVRAWRAGPVLEPHAIVLEGLLHGKQAAASKLHELMRGF